MKAIWNGQVLTESDDTIVIEGNGSIHISVEEIANEQPAWYYSILD